MEEKLLKILEEVAKVKGFKNYELHPHLDVLRGDGFLSEFYTGDVRDKDTGDVVHTYIKNRPSFDMMGLNSVTYNNEYHFYSTIVPELKRFQEERAVETSFEDLPIFYYGSVEPEKEFIALENLKQQNYELFDKFKTLDDSHLKYIFKAYGKYHALSFAFKQLHPEKYSNLVSPIEDIFFKFTQLSVVDAIRGSILKTINTLEDVNFDAAEKVKSFIYRLTEIFEKSVKYNGKFSCLTHGDCWSNNMMFKYGENQEISSMKLLDFQLLRDSTPIHDLSYFFYSGASYEDFKELDNYLHLYYQSFTTFALELGCPSEKLFSFNELKSEWKENCLLGIFMSILVYNAKLMKKEDVENISQGKPKTTSENNENDELDNLLKRRTSDILVHAVEKGIL